MSHLGTLTGNGRIIINSQDIGEVEYRIYVYKPNALIEGHGRIAATSSVIHQISSSQKTTLKLSDGNTVEIVTPSWDVRSGMADILTSGPIPGYS